LGRPAGPAAPGHPLPGGALTWAKWRCARLAELSRLGRTWAPFAGLAGWTGWAGRLDRLGRPWPSGRHPIPRPIEAMRPGCVRQRLDPTPGQAARGQAPGRERDRQGASLGRMLREGLLAFHARQRVQIDKIDCDVNSTQK
jgi:hypothetical protein